MNEPSQEQLDELAMECDLLAFAQLLPPDVELAESHRIAFRAGWRAGHEVTSADDLFMRLGEIASAKDVAENGPNLPGTLRSTHAVMLSMNEILRALGDVSAAGDRTRDGSSAPVAPPEPVCPVTGVWEATCSCGRHAPPAGGTLDALQENTAGMIREAFGKLVRPAGGTREVEPSEAQIMVAASAIYRRRYPNAVANRITSADRDHPSLKRIIADAQAALFAALAERGAGTAERSVRHLAATLLCEVGKVDDPRLADVKRVDVRDLPRVNQPFHGVPRPLSDAEADAILAEYFAGTTEREP